MLRKLGGVVCIKQYRNEWKYICTEADLAKLNERISQVLELDCNSDFDGKYEIHSLYFDDFKNTCMMDNNAGVNKRYKYRIRYYGNNINTLRLERKEKNNDRCCKQSCEISQEIFTKLLNNEGQEVYWETNNAVLKKFCVDMMTRHFAPKVIINYERTAYVEPITNIRITLDRYITATCEIESFLQGSGVGYPVCEKDEHILEIKFDAILPAYIKNIVTGSSLVQTAFSKYYLGRQTLLNGGR